MATLRYLIDQTLIRMSMQSGIDTQIYTEERLRLALQYRFDMLFDSYWWPQFFVQQEEYALDGVSGMIVGDVSLRIRRFTDIHSVYNENSNSPLPRAPNNVRIRDISSPCVQSVPLLDKVFRILPMISTGTVAVTYRKRPALFEADADTVNMDEQLMICGAAFDLLEDDATNPGAADKFRMMYDEREKLLAKNQHQMSMSSGLRENISTRWR